MKTTKTSKLINILRESKTEVEEISLLSQSKQAHINTQQEILDTEALLDKQNIIVYNALIANPFSASKLYTARKEKILLEMKLKGMQDILSELF